jgi:hypothetical protein
MDALAKPGLRATVFATPARELGGASAGASGGSGRKNSFGPLSASAAPHSWQEVAAVASLTDPHCGQGCTLKGAPHALQYLELAGFA